MIGTTKHNPSRIIYPTIRKKDDDYYQIAQRTGDYKIDRNDPILDILLASPNVTMIQEKISDAIKRRMNIIIPPQNYFDIQEAIEHVYNNNREVTSSIQFQRSADILRRVMQFDHAWKSFDMKKELGPPKSDININNLIADINTRALHKLIKIVEASIRQRLRYEKEMNRSYPSRINRRLMNRYTKPVPIKEKAKFNGPSHVDFGTNSIRRYVMPQYMDTFSVPKDKQPREIY